MKVWRWSRKERTVKKGNEGRTEGKKGRKGK